MAESELKVPKRAVRAEILQRGAQAARAVTLFVADAEEVLDLLENGPPFLPANDVESGAFVLLARRAVMWVRVPAEHRGDLELFDSRRDVSLELDGGQSLDGELLYTAPPAEARLVDYLNAQTRFLRLDGEEHVYFVNKDRVACILELPAPKRS